MKNYKVSEERLKELLLAEALIECLYQDGIDNWWGFMEGRDAYISDTLGISEEEVQKQGLDFDDVAEAALADFQEI